ncbi:MAG: hypothetical protein LBU38_06535 [Propionibacteriaceae bacterium]|jgi:hypothetical protein|nr:hypothetical protein [Propionibacteriaceae bacterium]
MSWELSMAARREITKKYAREYGKADRKTKSVMLDELAEIPDQARNDVSDTN